MGLFSKFSSQKEEKSKPAKPAKEVSDKKASPRVDSGEKTVIVGEKKEGASYPRAYEILVKPLVTERATILSAENKYVFAVSPDANKVEIAKAVAAIYGPKPTSVNIVNVKGKKVRRGRTTGKRKDWKKAIVTLPAGKEIKIYEGV